ncbi:hypothetical protein [Novosphingobium sp.]|jgi:hypothetical protein|uniref:hypothetical protein n=1 Tax=Novosphingobium sp. TaxID=1874826 RepID=UPI002FE108F6
MADKGIIFSAPMVRALLAGRKTQTRRLLKPVPEVFPVDDKGTPCEVGYLHVEGEERPRLYTGKCLTIHKATFAEGDRLYVRETCRAIERKSGLDQFQYRATLDWEDDDAENVPNEPEAGGWGDLSIYGRGKRGRKNFATCEDDLTFAGPWVPAIHVPRTASRLWLAVTEVRVQRLKECSEADAKAEGIEGFACIGGQAWRDFSGGAGFNMTDPATPATRSYATLWDSLHTTEGQRWDDNPWIVAVTFEVHRGNIDAGLA